MDKKLYTARFEAIATIVNPDESDRFIAKASLVPLAGLLPSDIKPEENPDLLYFASNGAVAGLANKNGDAITTETAVSVNRSAKHKYISTEHDRDSVCGVILQPGFSKFGTNEPLTEEQALRLKEPFNMAFAGAIWKVINPMIAKYIQKQGDSIGTDVLSMSWEIAFDSFDIGIGSKNIFDARIVTAEDPVFETYKRMLRCEGGSGENEKKEPVFRIIKGEPVILGYSIVANPAAEVKGIIPLDGRLLSVKIHEEKAPETKQGEAIPVTQENSSAKEPEKKVEEKSINSPNDCVTSTTRQTMKIENLKQLEAEWAEIRKLETAASLVDFVKAIEDGSREYVKKLEDRENALKIAEEAKANAEKILQETKATVEELRKQLDEVKAAQEQAKATQQYQDRMNAIDAEFDLDDEDRQLIASDIKDLDDEAFAKYMAKCKKLMCGKAKKGKAEKKCDPKEEEKEDEEECAKKAKAAAEEAEALKAAMASVEEKKDQPPPLNGQTVEPTLKEQMEQAFGESFKIDGKPAVKKQEKS